MSKGYKLSFLILFIVFYFNTPLRGQTFQNTSTNSIDYLSREMAEIVSKASVGKRQFTEIAPDVDGLWEDLLKNGYINYLGYIQNPFRALDNESMMITDFKYLNKKKDIFNILFKAQNIQYREAINLFINSEKILSIGLPDDTKKINGLYMIVGYFYGRLGEYQKAADFLERGILFFEKNYNNQMDLSPSFFALGTIYKNYLMNYQKAQECLEKSLIIAKEKENKTIFRNCLVQLLTTYSFTGKDKEEVELFEKNRPEIEGIIDPKVINGIYSGVATSYNRLQNYEKSIFYGEKAFDFFSKFNKKLAIYISCGALIDSCLKLKDYKKNEKYSLKTIELAKEINEKDVLFNCYYSLGLWYGSIDETEKKLKAIRYLLEAKKYADKYEDQKKVRESLAFTYSGISETEKGVSESLELIELAKQNGDYAKIYSSYYNLGLEHLVKIKDNLAAQKYFLEADKYAQTYSDKLNTKKNLSHIYHYLLLNNQNALKYDYEIINLAVENNDYDTVIEYSWAVANVLYNTGDFIGEEYILKMALNYIDKAKPKNKYEILSQLSSLYNAQFGNLEKSLFYLKKCLDFYDDLDLCYKLSLNICLFEIYHGLGNEKEMKLQAMQISKILSSVKNNKEVDFNTKSSIFLLSFVDPFRYSPAMKDFVATFKKDIEEKPPINKDDLFGFINYYHLKFNIEIYLGNYSEAELLAKSKLIPVYLEKNLFQYISIIYGTLALAYTNNPEKRINFLKKQISLIEEFQAKILEEKEKIGYLGKNISSYELLVMLYADRRQFENALTYLEKYKQQAFWGLLRKNKFIKSPVLEKASDLLRQRDILTEGLEYMEIDEKQGAKLLKESILKKIGEISEEYKNLSFDKSLSSKEQFFISKNLEIKISDVQNCLDKNTSLVEYFVFETGVYVWVINNDDFIFKQTSITSDDLKTGNLNSLINDYLQKLKKNDNSYRPLSEKLYKYLIAPIKDQLKKNIVIIPYKNLHFLPFETLFDENGKFLIETHNISYCPSANYYLYSQSFSQKRNENILVFADPRTSDKNYQNLNHSEDEARDIKTIFNNCKLFAGPMATEDNVKNYSKDFEILHFACHADFNDKYLDKSAVLLTPSSKEDGKLTIKEISSLKLDNTNLVVLSACNTARGEEKSGDEVVGFVRAILYAGCPSTIASLWEVNDQSTAFLMADFYRNLKEKGMDKATALWHAKKDFIAKPPLLSYLSRGIKIKTIPQARYSNHPYYWAPFILIGKRD